MEFIDVSSLITLLEVTGQEKILYYFVSRACAQNKIHITFKQLRNKTQSAYINKLNLMLLNIITQFNYSNLIKNKY